MVTETPVRIVNEVVSTRNPVKESYKTYGTGSFLSRLHPELKRSRHDTFVEVGITGSS